MSNAWDIAQIRKIAGLPLNEAYDGDEGDDDMTPAERELAAKADKDLKSKGVRVPKVNPDKDLHKLAKSSKKSEESKEAAADREEREAASSSKSEADKEKSERSEVEKEATPAHTAQKQERREAAAKEEAKRRGKAPSDSSFAGQLRGLQTGGGSRQEGWALAQKLGKSSASFATAWQKAKSGNKTATEAFIITHPNAPSFMLAENREMGTHQWVDMNSVIEPMVFFTEKEANELAQHLADWKSQIVNVVRVSLVESDDEVDEPTDKEAFSKGREWLKSNPEASRDEFASHMTANHKWAKVTSHSSYDAMKK